MQGKQPRNQGHPRAVLSTKLDDETRQRVVAYAEEANLSMSAAVAQLVANGLDHAATLRESVKEANSLRARLAAVRQAAG